VAPRGNDPGKSNERKAFAPANESGSMRRSAGGPERGLPGHIGHILGQAGPAMAAVWTLSATIVLGVLGGWWLDRRFGTRPWLLIAGMLLGLVIGMYQLGKFVLGSRNREP